MRYVKLIFLVMFLVGCGEADRGKAFITATMVQILEEF